MKYCKLHLLRHGLTQGNLEGRYIGAGSDLPLCEQGRAQLLALKERFPYPPAQVVFVSPLQRARQTAELLYPGVRQLEIQDLREMHFGVFEGRTPQELADDPDFAAWMDPASDVVPAGGESRRDFALRTDALLMKLFEYLLRAHVEQAACVTHGGVIVNMLARHALPQLRPQEWMADPGAGFSLRCDAQMWMRDQMAEVYDLAPCGYGEEGPG